MILRSVTGVTDLHLQTFGEVKHFHQESNIMVWKKKRKTFVTLIWLRWFLTDCCLAASGSFSDLKNNCILSLAE